MKLSPPEVFDALGRGFVASTRVAATPGFVAGERPGLRYAAIGGPIPAFNRLIATTPDPRTIDAELDRAIADLASFPMVSAWIGPDARPADLEVRLVERGFAVDREEPDVPAMAADLEQLAALDVPPGSTISLAASEAERGRAVDVAMAGFGAPPELRPWLDEFVRRYDTDGPMRAFVVEAGGRPVSTALGCLTDGVVAIYNVATVPDARGRGHGGLATLAVMHDAASRGARAAVLESSDIGFSVYRRVGFLEAGRFRVLLKRNQPPA